MSGLVLKWVERPPVRFRWVGPTRELSEAPRAPSSIAMLVGPKGPKGDDGADGVGAAFTHQQEVPALIWVVDHMLGRKPIVALTDTNDAEIEASVVHPSLTRTTIVFSQPVAGAARLF